MCGLLGRMPKWDQLENTGVTSRSNQCFPVLKTVGTSCLLDPDRHQPTQTPHLLENTHHVELFKLMLQSAGLLLLLLLLLLHVVGFSKGRAAEIGGGGQDR